MQQSLLQNTARINNSYEEQELENFYTSPSTNTSSCINNGIIISQISFIEKSIFSFIKTQDIVEYNCIIYGGYAKKISKFLSLPHVVFNNMVMLGLARVLND
jgi:pantothenate kinase type III